jgi:hypothetical protein
MTEFGGPTLPTLEGRKVMMEETSRMALVLSLNRSREVLFPFPPHVDLARGQQQRQPEESSCARTLVLGAHLENTEKSIAVVWHLPSLW